MKRAHLQRVKPVEYSPSQVEGSVERLDQTVNGVKRKKRTSAAMIGLALSMGASSLLIPRQNEGATAAEPTPTDAATLSPVPLASAAPAALMTEHVVTKGQTLWQLARRYQVSVEAIAVANALKPSDIVRVGQTLRIPTGAGEVNATEEQQSVEFSTLRSPQRVASANLDSLSLATPSTSPRAETLQVDVAQAQRDMSLNRLRQQQEKLRQALAKLKTKDQSAKAEVPSSDEVTIPQSSAIASKPSYLREYQTQSSNATTPVTLFNSGSSQQVSSNSSDPDWLRNNQALTVPPTATGLITQVPSAASVPTVSAPVRVVDQLPRRSNVQQVAANPKPEMVSYQVNLGDTVARIANAHNISPSTLVQANRISDPNFIFVGQILRVPATQVMATAPAPRARQVASQAAPSQQQASARLSVVPPTATALANPALANPASVIQSSPGIGGSVAAPSTSGLDPHVETLLSEIKILRERHRAATPAPSIPVPEAVQVAASNLPTPSVSTQFNPGGLNTVQTDQPQRRTARSQVIPLQVPAAENPRHLPQPPSSLRLLRLERRVMPLCSNL
ncbi:MAG: LysM peptidoglycan-binding domain-containing protein [Leptolyngbyaceae cyanobacterium CSU_1_4]|nr:LysM peptidoglycan-binding domain-containing protein [Leptolyngbyaceae cyanobacterium CSU_1_4]